MSSPFLPSIHAGVRAWMFVEYRYSMRSTGSVGAHTSPGTAIAAIAGTGTGLTEPIRPTRKDQGIGGFTNAPFGSAGAMRRAAPHEHDRVIDCWMMPPATLCTGSVATRLPLAGGAAPRQRRGIGRRMRRIGCGVVVLLIAACDSGSGTTDRGNPIENPADTTPAANANDRVCQVRPCIFISYRHREPDLTIARQIAETLSTRNFGVYFDEYDRCLSESGEVPDDTDVAGCIERGLDRADALFSTISTATLSSPWIPYEIGSARGRLRVGPEERSELTSRFRYPGHNALIGHLIFPDVEQVPEFVRLGQPLKDLNEVLQWADTVRSLRGGDTGGRRGAEPTGRLELPEVLTRTIPLERETEIRFAPLAGSG